jgi:hypothetical protein
MNKLSLNVSLLILAVASCAACIGSPRTETASSTAPASAPQAQQVAEKQAAVAPAANDYAPAPTESASPVRSETFASPPPEPKAKAPEAHRERKEARGAIASASRSSSDDESSMPHDLLQDALSPTAADPPMLRTALQDLMNAAQQLSAGHSCEQGCKAYQSMQRAAVRICELAPSNDPSLRCTAAQNRVAMADGELKRRCGVCP